MRGIIIKKLTKEQYPWLSADVEIGEIVYKFFNNTYGTISSAGVAVSKYSPMDYPFFEVPNNAVEWNYEA